MFNQDPWDLNYSHLSLPSLLSAEGPPFHCLLCSKQYPHLNKLLFHYVANHRFRFCGECSVAMPTEQSRMTHENQKHWPFQCRRCYAEFFSLGMLNQHYSSEHSFKACDLCNEVLDLKHPNKTYPDHLRSQHDAQTDISPDVLATRSFVDIPVGASDANKPISKFHCRLCSKDKLLINFQGHFLHNHKLTLHKFLEMTDQFVAIQPASMLDRLGVVVAASKKTSTSQLTAPPGVDDFWDHFEMMRKEELPLTETVFDFDSSLVQCVVSTDDDEDSEDDGGSAAGSSRRLCCLYCSESAAGRFNFGKHLQNVHGFQVKNFENRCSSCRKSFGSHLAVARHNRIYHTSSDTRLMKCPFCEETGGSRDEMRKHIREHVDCNSFACGSDRLAFRCRFCAKSFWTVDSKDAHQMRLHTNEMSSSDYMMCVHCGETMSSKTRLRIHTADAHPTLTQIDKVIFKCEICLIAHAKLDDCRAHMLLAHPHKLAAYCKLESCRTRLGDDQTMDEHLTKAHPALIHFKCRWCKVMVKSRQGCLKHIRIKHPNLSAKLLHEC